MKGAKRRQKEIAQKICEMSPATLRDVAEAMGLSTNGMSQSAGALFGRGVIEYVDPQSRDVLDSPVRWVPRDLHPTEPSPSLFD